MVDALQRERVLPLATDLLAQFNPGKPTLDASIRALQLLAEDIAPQLGWVRRRQNATACSREWVRPETTRYGVQPTHISIQTSKPLARIGRS